MATTPPREQTTGNARNAQLSRIEGEEDATDTALIAKSGRNVVEDYGVPLGTASTGALQNIDIDEARQRLRDVQTSLIALGYSLGATNDPATHIDGVWGPATRDAVASFQSDWNLRGEGRLTPETYEAILGAYEEGMSTQARAELHDDFAPIQANQPLGGGDLENEESEGNSIIADNSTVELMNLQEEFEADEGTPESLAAVLDR